MSLDKQSLVAKNIRYLRNVFGFTQDDIAQVVHLSRCTYAQFESGKKVPTADTLLMLASFYHIGVDTILRIDTNRVVNDVIYSDRCNSQMTHLLDAYYHLPETGRKQLLDKARLLFQEEADGIIPSFGSVNWE